MFAAVEKLYRHGAMAPPQGSPLVGQLRTYSAERNGRKHCLKLWPLDWLEHVESRWEPLAVLWLPEFVAITGQAVLLRGVEEVAGRPARQWMFQKWRCQPLTAAAARAMGSPADGMLAP